jgi:hypothetical protein
MKVYNYECYLLNPKTKEKGWTIEMISVFANNGKEARERLKRFVPDFDTTILLNWSEYLNHSTMAQERDIYESGCNFFYTYNNQPCAPLCYSDKVALKKLTKPQ